MKTLRQVRNSLRPVGITIHATEFADYRVNYRNGSEDTAYYTECLDDALETGSFMGRHGR